MVESKHQKKILLLEMPEDHVMTVSAMIGQVKARAIDHMMPDATMSPASSRPQNEALLIYDLPLR